MFLSLNIRFLAAHFPLQMCAVGSFGAEIDSETCEINKSCLPVRCGFFPPKKKKKKKSTKKESRTHNRLLGATESPIQLGV